MDHREPNSVARHGLRYVLYGTLFKLVTLYGNLKLETPVVFCVMSWMRVMFTESWDDRTCSVIVILTINRHQSWATYGWTNLLGSISDLPILPWSDKQLYTVLYKLMAFRSLHIPNKNIDNVKYSISVFLQIKFSRNLKTCFRSHSTVCNVKTNHKHHKML